MSYLLRKYNNTVLKKKSLLLNTLAVFMLRKYFFFIFIYNCLFWQNDYTFVINPFQDIQEIVDTQQSFLSIWLKWNILEFN